MLDDTLFIAYTNCTVTAVFLSAPASILKTIAYLRCSV